MDSQGTKETATVGTAATADTTDTAELRLLGRKDHLTLAGDSRDVRGFTVVARDGREVGTVEHLVVDPRTGDARFLGVHLGGGRGEPGSGGHVLIPMGGAELAHEGTDKVYVNESAAELGAFPEYDEGSIGSLLHTLSDLERSEGPITVTMRIRQEISSTRPLRDDEVFAREPEARPYHPTGGTGGKA